MKANSFKKLYIILFLLVLFIFQVYCPFVAKAEEEREEGYFTVYKEGTSEVIFLTNRMLYIGDQYLDEQNNLYEVVKISKDKAYAKFVKNVDIQSAIAQQEEKVFAQSNKTAGNSKEKVIAIYHTHSDESYIPTDGKSSIPYKGGIFKVGASLKRALEEKGIKVIQSSSSHDPHDSMAYQRSRRTATELLKTGPDAIIDVHRDGVPAEEYHGEVHGKPLAKVRLVVGRQNPQMSAINNFAWQLKANADKKYPGLIKGIFYGKGNYNQDLYPRTILVEAGTYTNSRYRAQDGANILADVIATTLYGEDYEKKITPKGKAITQVKGENKSATKTILWIFAIAIVGGGAFLVMSMGGFKEFSSKIKRFTGSDYTSFLHQKKDKKQDNEDSEDSEEK